MACSPRSSHPPSGSETEILLESLLQAGFSGSMPVSGDGMRPAIEPGDRVIVTPFLGLPRPGQIVMARHRGRVVARRLVDVRMIGGRRRYCLREDADPGRGCEVLREDLVGRPTAILRRGILVALDDGPALRRNPPRPGRTRRRAR